MIHTSGEDQTVQPTGAIGHCVATSGSYLRGRLSFRPFVRGSGA